MKTISTLMLLCVALFASAQDPKFTATLSNSNIIVGEQIQVTFSFEGNGSNFRAPSFTDFNLLMGPSTSSSMQWINGTVSQTVSYTYVIQSTKEGTFKMPGATIESGGKKITSNGFTITVGKGSAQTQSGSGNKQGGNENTVAGGKNVFLRASLDKSNVYQGEGIVVTYKLYTKVTLTNYTISKMPALNGFFSQDITMPQQLEFHQQNIDGVAYKVADIKKMVLFPQRTGILQLDAMEGEVVARVQVKRNQQQQNDPFNQMFNDPFFNNPFFNNSVQDVKVPLKSESVKITVRDLPSDAPPSFKGAVGRFTMDVSLDRKETKSHEPVALKIKVSGKGNLKLIDPPVINFPAEFETYDPKVTSNIVATTGGVNGSKSFEYLLIPRNAGEFKIPVSGFSYFDLEKKQYENIPAKEFILKVTKGDETISTVTGVNKSDVQFIGKDIHYIKTNKPEFIKAGELFFNSGLFYSMMTAPAILFVLVFALRKRNDELQSNVSLLKSRKANRVAKKRLASAKKLLDENKRDLFLDEMFRVLWGFVSDKLQILVSELTKENVSNALQSRKVSEESIKMFIETLDSCEYARFAPGMAGSNEEIYKKGMDVISGLEEEIV